MLHVRLPIGDTTRRAAGDTPLHALLLPLILEGLEVMIDDPSTSHLARNVDDILCKAAL